MAFFKNEWVDKQPYKDPPYTDAESIVMTKKDFVEIADVLKRMDHVPEEYRIQMALAFIHFFQARNERFNEVMFMTACGFSNPASK